MKEFDKTLNYNDMITCQQNTVCEETLTVISNLTLRPVFDKFVAYYKEGRKVKYLDVNSYLAAKAQLDSCFVLLNLRELAPFLYYHFYELDKEIINREIEQLEEMLRFLCEKLKKECRRVLFSSFEQEYEIKDVKGQLAYQYVIDQLNDYITKLAEASGQFQILPMDRLIAKIGREGFYNQQNYYQINAPYSVLGCNALAHSVLIILEQIKNQSRKCLILDCDNVLWGGILGEDGAEGILLSNQFIGRAYLDFQREIIKLYYQGIIICLCSKNKLSDVKKIINQHPDMLLREKYIAAMRINYNNKADNIRSLAEELNINTDSIVFVDDSSYEISLVKQELPEVAVVQLDAKRPYTYAGILGELPYFYKKEITENDLIRGKQYREQEKRLQNKNTYTNLAEYHASLKTEITINRVDEYSLARVAELSQRSNQFNLSGMHYSLEELQLLLHKDFEILYLRARDKFGDMGIVASAVLRYGKDYAVIEAMFLSCRAFGRGFELELLKEIKITAFKRKLINLYGVYSPNLKNERFQDFYKENNIPLYCDAKENI